MWLLYNCHTGEWAEVCRHVLFAVSSQVRDPDRDKKRRSFTGAASSWRNLVEKSADLTQLYKNNRFQSVGGNALQCDDCEKRVTAESAKSHCNAKVHQRKKTARQNRERNKREGKQSSIRLALKSAEKSEFDAEQNGHRFVLTAACLKVGMPMPMNALDGIRPAIDAASRCTLTHSSHLKRDCVPPTHKWELGTVKDIVSGKQFAWFHDAATRMKECLAIVVRILRRNEDTGKLECVMVLARLKFLPKSSNALTLAGDQAAALAAIGLRMEEAVHANCDACSTNLAAVDVMEQMFGTTFFALCMSHLGANAGSKLAGAEVDKFFKDFISVMNHPSASQKDWTRMTGLKHVGCGGVRWFDRLDVLEDAHSTLGREGTMQTELSTVGAAGSSSVPGRNLRAQETVLTPTAPSSSTSNGRFHSRSG